MPSNEEILLKFIKGDIEALNWIYKHYHSRLFYFIKKSVSNHQDTEEIVQEIFIKLWKKKGEIDIKKSFDSYLYTIAKNSIHDHLRKVLREKQMVEDFITDFSISEDQLENVINYRDTEAVLMQLIESLPPKRREAFKLSRFKGKSYREISQIMEISENTVDTHIRKSLQWIRKGMIRYSSVLFVLLPIQEFVYI